MSPLRRLVGWLVLVSWVTVAEELWRCYEPLWGALFVLVTLAGGLVLDARSRSTSNPDENQKVES